MIYFTIASMIAKEGCILDYSRLNFGEIYH